MAQAGIGDGDGGKRIMWMGTFVDDSGVELEDDGLGSVGIP